jgi:hypothetical protein
MTIGSLDSETDALNRTCIEELGDPITYKAAGQAAKTIYAYVDHSDGIESWGAIQGQSQEISVEVLKADVPTVSSTDEITLPQISTTFYPKGDPRNNRDGRHWHITLQRKR